MGFCRFLKKFPLFHMRLGLHSNWAAFRGVLNMGLMGLCFQLIFGPQISQNSGLHLFPKKFPLVSYQSWFTSQFELLIAVCLILVSEAWFGIHFVPQNRWKFRSLVIFSKIFHRFHIILIWHDHLGYLYLNYVAPKALFLGLDLRRSGLLLYFFFYSSYPLLN